MIKNAYAQLMQETNPEPIQHPPQDQHPLEAMGVTHSLIKSCLEAGFNETTTCTANHPTAYAGQKFYGEVTYQITTKLKLLGWTLSHDSNMHKLVSPCGMKNLIVYSGCPSTGLKGQTPSNRNKKGRGFTQAVEANGSMPLLTLLNPDTNEPLRKPSGIETWVLLYFYDSEESVIRCELSRPKAINNKGHIDQWLSRFPWPTIDVKNSVTLEPAFNPDIDLNIQPVSKEPLNRNV
jgi:hypothetical protein